MPGSLAEVLRGNRIGVPAEDGTVHAKDGPLNASWVTLTSTGPIA